MLTKLFKRGFQTSVTTLAKVKVRVSQGVVTGIEQKLPDGRSCLRFSEVPYAKPPINGLKFRSPQKLLKFDQDEIDCSSEVTTLKFGALEDCLKLSVHVPADKDSTKKLPVFVFLRNHVDQDLCSPDHLLMEGVIVVTVSYRLHALGFASLPNVGISGNAGLKDQQMALEWVHENIASFNGDPDNIVLFGEPSCVHLHVLNDISRGFLSKVILQNGTAISDWALQSTSEEITRKLAKQLGSKGDSDRDHLEALTRATSRQMFDYMNVTAFKPIIEAKSDDAFITKSPISLIKEKQDQIKTSMLIGFSNGNGMTKSAAYKKNLQDYSNDMLKMIPPSVNIDRSSEATKKLAQKISKFYFGTRGLTPELLPLLNELVTDVNFSVPMSMVNELYSRYQHNCTQFVYEFGISSELEYFKKVLEMEDVRDASRFNELSYLFGRKSANDFPEHSREHKLRGLLCRFYANFAKYGEPTPNHDNSSTIKWHYARAVAEGSEVIIDYLKFGNEEVKMHKHLYKPRIDFWRGIYEDHNGSFLSPKCLA